MALVLLLSGDVFAQFELISKAQPDEFYTGLGLGYIPLGQQDSSQTGQPKTNEDYVWSMATDGQYIWFGTGSGALAIAFAGGLFPAIPPQPHEYQSENGIPFRVWEYGASQYPVLTPFQRKYFGDWRPPRMYQYDTLTKQFVNRTPDDPLLLDTLGLRSAGVWNGVAIFGGASLSGAGVNFFAFEVASGRYLGSRHLVQYSNIRRWIVANGQLYTSVMNTKQSRVRGSVLKWTGSSDTPFSFTVVGHLDNEGAYLAYHDGRLFVGTWPSQSTLSKLSGSDDVTPSPMCGIWMSPKLTTLGSLWPVHAKLWQKVWDPTWYESEPGVYAAYAMGAMESYGDSLFFGTLHFPTLGGKSFEDYYGFQAPTPRNTERRPIIVRAQGFGGRKPATLELLYGNADVPVFHSNGMGSGTWVDQPNALRMPGRYGNSGFGNPNNTYTWSSSVHEGVLYFGTMDTTGFFNFGSLVDGLPEPGMGGDLWKFSDPGQAAVAVDVTGCGNSASHGIRNMVSTPNGLFLGMANSANLLTDPTDNLPDGGWEFLRLRQE